jgi:hypothetical protein
VKNDRAMGKVIGQGRLESCSYNFKKCFAVFIFFSILNLPSTFFGHSAKALPSVK